MSTRNSGEGSGTGTTNAFLASVGGALNDTAAAGVVTDVDTAMAYIKQLVTAIQLIPTTAMRGTDSAALASVLGALDDAIASGDVTDVDTLMAYMKQAVTDTETLSTHTQLFTGAVFYVDAEVADDTEDGTTPRKAKKTINAAIGAASVYGDAIIVKAGTYVEDVVMSKANMEMYFEKGAILDGTGTCLTVSGGYCKVVGPVLITPAADQIGVVIDTLGSNDFYKMKVIGAASAGGFDIDTALNDFHDCRVGGVKADAKAWDIGGSSNVLNSCSTNGTTTSYGYYVHGAGALVRGKLSGCTSTGHQTSGYYLDNITGMTVVDCSSGAGDGAREDVNDANAWCGYCFDQDVVKANTLSVAGGGGTSEYNLYK